MTSLSHLCTHFRTLDWPRYRFNAVVIALASIAVIGVLT